MEGFGLPMSFGKKTKVVTANVDARLQQTKRAEPEPTKPSTSTEEKKVKITPEASTSDEPVDVDDGDESDEEVGPVPPSATGKRKATEEEDEEDEFGFESDDEQESDPLPVSHEIVLKDHNKVVSAIAIDPSGARIASGSHDYETKLWDFGGMGARLKPFKSFEANGNYHVHDVSYSADGQSLLVVSGTFYPKVFSREGDGALEFIKGDVYLRDMRNTSGHTAEINGGSFHPTDPNLFLTCSNDSTLRIWDMRNTRKQKAIIVVKSKERGARTRVTACAWSPDGKMIAGACLDGTLHIWKTDSNLARPDKSCDTAHTKNTETTSVAWAQDGFRLVTRGSDNTVKVWDSRKMRKPLAVAENLDVLYSETNVIFSPDDKWILTGLPGRQGTKGSIVFLNSETLVEERRVAIAEGTVARVLWHSRINQIIATMSTGAIHVLYSPHASLHGALLPLQKMPRTAPRDPSYSTADLKPVIFTPDALPMYADQGHRMSLHQKEKKAKMMRPTEPMTGAGRGGRLGASATQSLVQALFTKDMLKEDPREALLKYADKKDDEEK